LPTLRYLLERVALSLFLESITILRDPACRCQSTLLDEKDFSMRTQRAAAFLTALLTLNWHAAASEPRALPSPAAGWSIELVASAPEVLYPTAIVGAPDGAVYIGSDLMDMPGPPTVPRDRVIRRKDGRTNVFADKLWSVMGLEWVDDTLYVVHAPFLSALRDNDGDGRADTRIDLVTGLGPKLPGWSGLNEHVASGLRLGMDGFLYIAVGDKGLPRAMGRDGKTIQLRGGGVIRVRPDGTDLESVSTGERNPLSVALSAADEVFTYGNDDDSKTWPNSLTHHIVGGHYGYPYQFRTSPWRALPVMSGQFGGAGAQGLCYNEDGLPAQFRANLFFCDWGLQTVFRVELRTAGGTFALARRTPIVTRGEVTDFRPFSLAVAADRTSFYLVDWACNGWLDGNVQTGRLYRLTWDQKDQTTAQPRPRTSEDSSLVAGLDHPALSIRLESQRALVRRGTNVVPLLCGRLEKKDAPTTGRLHALWALDAIGGEPARKAIDSVLVDSNPELRIQAVRSAGIRADHAALPALVALLVDRDPAVRREAAIALSKLGDRAAASALYKALGDSDTFAAWSVRQAIRRLEAWDKDALVEALQDDRRREAALRLTDEAWDLTVVEALATALRTSRSAAVRTLITANLAGLYRQYPEWDGSWFGTNPLALPPPRKTKNWSPEGMKAVLAGLAVALSDSDRLVRAQAIRGISQAGAIGAPLLRATLRIERDPANQAELAEALGRLGDIASVPLLSAILSDAERSESARLAALDSLARLRDRTSLQARLALIFDANTPAELVARALPDLARERFLPPNELWSFFENPAPAIRAAALLSLNVNARMPAGIEQAVIDRLKDQSVEVREAAMMAAVGLRLRAAVPSLAAIARDQAAPDRASAVAALCRLPDSSALAIYLAALQERDPAVRRAGELALLAIRDQVRGELATAARSQSFSGPAALALERVMARFEPVRNWRVIGPFPRTTPPIYLGERSIDFQRGAIGAMGRQVAWAFHSADPSLGRVDLDGLKLAAGDDGHSGYDKNGSPDLGAFAYAEFEVDNTGPALLLLGSSGSLIVTVNEKLVYQYVDPAGRAYEPDTDRVRVELIKGQNRIVVLSRQGVGKWCFSVHVSKSTSDPGIQLAGHDRVGDLRPYALANAGDPVRGEAIFFDPKGAGCAQCHAVGARGRSTIGPNLAGIALTYDRAELIRSVLEPSSRIAPGYQTSVIATRDGKIYSGLIRTETDQEIEIADSEAKIARIAKAEIVERRAGETSVMPGRVSETLSPAEFADLIAYLAGLKNAPSTARLPVRQSRPSAEGSVERRH
jgi:putative heme-binding domain-containing protein